MKVNMTEAIQEQEPTPNEPTTALVPREERPLSRYVDTTEAQGEFTNSDRERAVMQIVAKVGDLSNTFTPGDILLNKDFVIGGTKNPIELVALGIKKRYQNDLDFDGGEIGDTVDKAIEVVDRGGVLEYRPFD